MKISSDTVLVRQDKLASQIVDDKVVLLSLKDGSYFELNQIGTFIWNMLDTPQSVEQIFSALTAQHEVERKIMEKDVLPFLQGLLDRKFILVAKT